METIIKINGWNIRIFTTVILSVQFATLGLIGINDIGLQIPILRQLLGFVYLSFVPGIIILRLLKLHELGSAEKLLYSVGLSLTTLMVLGLSINFIYPYIGITNPFSILPLIGTLSVIISLLCLKCYIMENKSVKSVYQEFNIRLSPQILFLLLLPPLSSLGTYLVNFTGINTVLLFLLLVISIIPILALSKILPKHLFGLAILMIAISLLFHRSLISMYLWGWDINQEYHYSRLVVLNSIWDPAYFSNVNSTLSVVMLAPIYSIICDMSLIWVSKIVYPLLYSLIPLGLYQVYRKQTSDEIAFLAVFFFMAIFTFYQQMPELGRQEIAELYLVLIVLIFLNTEIPIVKKSSLLVIFSISMILSHYGITYIYLIYLLPSWVMLIIFHKLQRSRFYFIVKDSFTGVRSKTITFSYILFFVIVALSWHMYISNSSVYVDVIHILNRIIINIKGDFLNPSTTEGLNVTTMGTSSLLYTILKDLQFITIFFIVIGIVVLIAKRGYMNIHELYAYFSISNFGVCVLGMVLPFFATSITVARLYHITLIFLAPFCIIGGVTLLNTLFVAFGRLKIVKRDENSLRVLACFFCIFLLFNSGFMHQVLKDDVPNSISLNSTMDYPRFNTKEVFGAQWLEREINSRVAYSDLFAKGLLFGYIAPIWHLVTFTGESEYVDKNSFIYLRNLNCDGEIMIVSKKKTYERANDYINLSSSPFFTKVLSSANKIYNNSGAAIYYSGEYSLGEYKVSQ